MIKEIHLASIDIARIYDKEGVPKFITYPFWFVILLIGRIKNGYKN